MGKGTIIAHLGAGQYTVTVNQERARITAAISALTARIAELETRLSGMVAGEEKSWVALQKASLTLRLSLLQDHTTDPTVTAWCADLTTDLSGVVGTLEIPGERGTVQVRPGYMGAATYSATRDGQLQEAIASTPAGVFYNLALLPGWQRWKPTVRWGVLSDLDLEHHLCTVTLDAAVSSAQGLDINQSIVLSSVPIEYMDCNGVAFTNGDHVLVEFTDQDFDDPVVIGFKDNPQPCQAGEYVVVSSGSYFFVWNVVTCNYASISDGESGTISFPCVEADLTDWLAGAVDEGSDLFGYSYQGQHQDSTLSLIDCNDDPTPATCSCGECTTSQTADPDPSNEDHEAALPYIDENGDSVQNYAYYYGSMCDENTSPCPGEWDHPPSESERLVRLAVYRDLYGTRLPISKKLAIQNSHGGYSALRVQYERQDLFESTEYGGADSFYVEESETITFTVFTPIGQVPATIDEVYVNQIYYNYPTYEDGASGYQRQDLAYFDVLAVYAKYSAATICQFFYSLTHTESKSRACGQDVNGVWTPGYGEEPPYDWGSVSSSDYVFSVIASCRACDGDNTDPREESRNTAFETAINNLYAYGIAQEEAFTGISMDIYSHE